MMISQTVEEIVVLPLGHPRAIAIAGFCIGIQTVASSTAITDIRTICRRLPRRDTSNR
jgi:hypothetical protein